MKKISIIFLSFVIFIAPPFAYAGVGKYIINVVKQTPNAVKVSATNTATGAKHVINHGVSSRDMATAIGAGVIGMGVSGGLGLAFEVITGLALDAVDWVMDAENNQLKWREKDDNSCSDGYIYTIFHNRQYYDFNSHGAACQRWKELDSNFDGFTASTAGTPQNPQCKMTENSSSSNVLTYNISSAKCAAEPDSSADWQKIPLPTLAQKTIDLAKQGKAPAVKTIEDYVKKIANQGKLDAELDASTDISKSDKECSAGYEKVGAVCVKKPADEKNCPADTVKVGDKCIKKPKKDDNDPTQCGSCCDEMMEILGAMADMNAEFYANSLDNDAQMLVNLQLLNDQLDQLSNNFNDLLDEARQTNQTLTEINNNQTLHFNELKDAIQSGNADILAKLAEIQAAIDLTNLKLDAVNLNLEKINDNLEKMQKCEETEFNKKICDFIDWVKQEPDVTEDNGVVDITDNSEGISVDKNRINFSNQCPAPKTVSISVAGFPVSYELNYQPLCDFFIMLNPFVIGMGGISSALIIAASGRRL